MKPYISSVLAVLILSGCSAIDIKQYSDYQPRFELFDYFMGDTKGWGIVQDRKSVLTRQFTVNIIGRLDAEGNLVLEERFVWDNGEKSSRTWTISRIGEHAYNGRAEDVVGIATGAAYGNALNWQYRLNLEVGGSTWKIHFDDWMFLQPDNVLINRAAMSKFGFHVGDVTIVFNKPKLN